MRSSIKTNLAPDIMITQYIFWGFYLSIIPLRSQERTINISDIKENLHQNLEKPTQTWGVILNVIYEVCSKLWGFQQTQIKQTD